MDWCEDGGSSRDRERFCEVRDLGPVTAGTLAIGDSPNGSIQVTGGSRNDIRVRARVVTSADTMEQARSLAGQVEVSLGSNGRIRTDGPSTARRESWSVSYRAEVPTSTDLELDTSNGSVTINDVRGDIGATTSNGSLRFTNLAGDVRGRTSNGSVHVTLSGTRWDGDGLDISTSNGSASIDIPENYNARLVAGTSNGSLRVDFPIEVRGRISREVETSLGSGGPTVRVRSSNGSVRIGRR